MSQPGFRVQWAKGPSFAEVAEALGIRTNQIMSMMDPTGKKQAYSVFFTPDDDDPEMIWGTVVARDHEGILREQVERKPMPGMWEQVHEQIDRAMRKFDEDQRRQKENE